MSSLTGRAPKRLALLFGVPYNELGNVGTCIEQMATSLANRGFEITTVQGEEAGYQRLWQAMQTFLGGVVAGDAVVFYYAGHGYRLFDHGRRFPTIPMLVPMDVGESSRGSARALFGHDVRAWLEDIVRGVSVGGRANVTAILECCHAAELLADHHLQGDDELALVDFLADEVGKRARGLRGTDAFSEVVRVVSTAMTKSAYGPESGTVGLVTEALVEVLEAFPDEPWEALEHRLRARVHARGRWQWPGVEGPRQRLPFSLELPATGPAMLPLEWDHGDTLCCGLAELLGARSGDEYELYASPLGPRWGTAHVLADPRYLQSHHARPDDAPPLMWARKRRVGDHPRIFVRDEGAREPWWTARRSELEEMGFELVDAGARAPDGALATVERRERTVTVHDREGSRGGRWEAPAEPLARGLVRLLEHERLLELVRHRAEPWDPSRSFTLTWGRYDARGEPVGISQVSHAASTEGTAPPTVPADAAIWIEVSNDGQQPLSFSVLRVDASRGVELLTHESAAGITVPQQSTRGIGDGSIRLSPRGDGTELLLVVVSEEPLSLHPIQHVHERGGDRSAPPVARSGRWIVRTLAYRLAPAMPALPRSPRHTDDEGPSVAPPRRCGCVGAPTTPAVEPDLHATIATLRARNDELTRTLATLHRGAQRRVGGTAPTGDAASGGQFERALRELRGGCLEPDAVEVHALRIVGGHPVGPEDHPSCVAVGNAGGWSCSGVVIGPRLVLTAAHCTQVNRIMTGSDDLTRRPGVQVPILEVIPHGDIDVAILVLAQDVAVPPAPIASEADLRTLREVALVGYGYADLWARSGLGTKRRVVVPVLPVVEMPPETLQAWSREFGYDPTREMVGGRKRLGDSCRGDSGGPAYATTVTGRQVLVGITLRATLPTTKRASPPCGDGGVYALAPRLLPWIGTKADERGLALGSPPSGSPTPRATWTADVRRRAHGIVTDIRRWRVALGHDPRHVFIATDQFDELSAGLEEFEGELAQMLEHASDGPGWAKELLACCTAVERRWQLVRWIVAQRRDPSLGHGLQLADLAITDVVRDLAISTPTLADCRPLVVSEAIDSPAAVRGRDLIDSPGVVAGATHGTPPGSRLDLVLVPPGEVSSPWWLVLLLHELGHTLDARLGVSSTLWEVLGEADRNRLNATSRHALVMPELAADMVALALGGSAYAEALREMLRQRGASARDEAHPPAPGRLAFVERQVRALRAEGPRDVIHELLERLGLDHLLAAWLGVDQKCRAAGCGIASKQRSSVLGWRYFPAVAWHAARHHGAEEALDGVFEGLVDLAEAQELPDWARGDHGWQFVKRVLPQIRESLRKDGVKIVPPMVHHERMVFVGASQPTLAARLREDFPRRNDRPWEFIEVYILSAAGLRAMADAGEPGPLETQRDEALAALGDLLPQVATKWAIREYDFPFFFAGYFDWEHRGGWIHVSSHLYGKPVAVAPSVDHMWLFEEPSPDYRAYLEALDGLGRCSRPLREPPTTAPPRP